MFDFKQINFAYVLVIFVVVVGAVMVANLMTKQVQKGGELVSRPTLPTFSDKKEEAPAV